MWEKEVLVLYVKTILITDNIEYFRVFFCLKFKVRLRNDVCYKVMSNRIMLCFRQV